MENPGGESAPTTTIADQDEHANAGGPAEATEQVNAEEGVGDTLSGQDSLVPDDVDGGTEDIVVTPGDAPIKLKEEEPPAPKDNAKDIDIEERRPGERLPVYLKPVFVHRGFFSGKPVMSNMVPWKAAPATKPRPVYGFCNNGKAEEEGFLGTVESVEVTGHTFDVPVISYLPRGGMCWNIESSWTGSNEKYPVFRGYLPGRAKFDPQALRQCKGKHFVEPKYEKEYGSHISKKNAGASFQSFRSMPSQLCPYQVSEDGEEVSRDHPGYVPSECERLKVCKAGDVIVRVGDVDVTDYPFARVLDELRGVPKGKTVLLGLYRPLPGKTQYAPHTLEGNREFVVARGTTRPGRQTFPSFGRAFGSVTKKKSTAHTYSVPRKSNPVAPKSLPFSTVQGEAISSDEQKEEATPLPPPKDTGTNTAEPPQKKAVRAVFPDNDRLKRQLRAQIMSLKYLLGGENPPPKLLSDALQQGADGEEFGRVKSRRRIRGWENVNGAARRKKRRYQTSQQNGGDGEENWRNSSSKRGRPRGRRRRRANDDVIDVDLFEDEEELALYKKIKKQKKEMQAAQLKRRLMEDIIAARLRKLPSSEGGGQTIEFLVKFKRMSFLTGCKWVEPSVVAAEGDTQGCESMEEWLRDEDTVVEEWEVAKDKTRTDYFKPEWIEIDRILACRVDREIVNVRGKYGAFEETMEKERRKFFVKWKDQSYALATWELEDDLNDDRKLALFQRFNYPPILQNAPPILTRDVRPDPTEWAQYTESPLYNNNMKLRNYQIEGLNWLTFCWFNRRNSILADEMGLGKTVQVVSFLNHLKSRQGLRGPFLVVAPLATLEHWKREFEHWTDMNVVLYHASEGGRATREIIQNYEWRFPQGNREQQRLIKFNVLLTSYELISHDFEDLSRIHWRCVVVDEAHRLKNQSSQLVHCLNDFYMDHIVLMTGTPLQNDMLELWSLLHFIEPEKFADADTFLSRFGSMREASTLAELHDELRPYMLRRLKEDVEKSIPAKEETIVDVELTIKQKKYYRAIFERNRDILTGPVVKPKPEGGGGVPHSTGRSKGPSLINLEMEMRKCCCHPYMIDGIQDSEIVECQRSNAKQGKAVTTRADEIEHMIHCSGKMILLHKLLPKLRAEGHRVLIFSQFRYMLTLIGLLLEYHEMKYERLDGMVRGNERQKAIDRFSADEDTFAFLLSTKAGGVGLNLQSADTVILYDSDWNPQNDLQAQARAHRIGQTKPVRVYRLITTKTYEAEMFAKSSKKLGLSTAVFKHGTLEGGEATISDNRGGGGGMMSLLTMDKDEVEMLLRYGAYAILDKDDDSSANQFTEATIDQLLAKCTTIRYDSDKKTAGSSLNGGVSQPVPSLSLSKASFMASTEDGKVNFGDENFWEKILGPKPVDRLMKFVRDGKLETVNLDQTREFLVEVGELVRSVRNSRSEGKVHSDTESIMEILIELKVRGSPDKSIDQKQLATFWIDLIENSRRRRNKKTSNACPKPKGPGKSWGVYGYSDDEDDDEGIKERPSVEEVPSSSDDDDEEDLGVLSMTDELMETEENVSGYISGITVRVKRKFGGFHATISAPNKESRGGVYVMAEPPKKLKISQGIKVLKILMMDPQSYVFRFPVDPEAQGLYDYNDVVKHSVSLSSILENAQNGMYGNHLDKCVSDQFYRDLNLVWYNCMLYNKDGSFICQLAKRMKIKCDLLLKSYDKMNAK